MMNKSDNDKNDVHIVYKKLGQTPLESIDELRVSHPELEHVPVTYAGRLDPLAEGTLILLSGDEVHNKEEYLALEKEYIFQILFGFSTDTYDILGRIQDTEEGICNTQLLEKALRTFVGTQIQAYPPYSSKTVQGKPLFEWARSGNLLEIDIPTHDVEIKKLELLKVETIEREALKKDIQKRIALVKGDFRQEEVLELWDAYLGHGAATSFDMATCNVVCSSGTYVRSLVSDIGHRLNFPAVTFSIQRKRVGEFVVEK